MVDATRTLHAAGSRIIVGNGIARSLGTLVSEGVSAHRAAIVTDSNVGPLYADAVQEQFSALSPIVITIPAGEAHKTRETWAHISDELLAHGLGRDSLIVALGGGVVGDLAGFVAATFLRGIPVVQVPTSLVAMIDASIGGKTAVDVPAGKNLIGAFHTPSLIVVDPEYLRTLPVRELRGGMAEALKHGAIADAAYFELVAAARPDAVGEIVARSIEIKSEVVNDDPRELGRRKTLNFGHTLGHAIESGSAFSFSHGESIAIGMLLEARLGERIGTTAPGTAAAIEAALVRLQLPTATTLSAADLVTRTRGDKKKRAGRVEYAIPARIGGFEQWSVPISDEDVLAVLTG